LRTQTRTPPQTGAGDWEAHQKPMVEQDRKEVNKAPTSPGVPEVIYLPALALASSTFETDIRLVSGYLFGRMLQTGYHRTGND
jgi:hypothetical protein